MGFEPRSPLALARQRASAVAPQGAPFGGRSVGCSPFYSATSAAPGAGAAQTPPQVASAAVGADSAARAATTVAGCHR